MAKDKRRRGGQELPDEAQDRPEQNAGYDAAVRGEGVEAVETKDELDPALDGGDDVQLHEEPESGQGPSGQGASGPDDRAERGAIADVRRRERAR